jgi:hypothetical protein
MAQADQSVQNATFPTVRADINNNLAALFSDSSGATAPTVTVAYQDWIDTGGTNPIWKKRNAANNAWITVATISASTIAFEGTLPSQSGQSGNYLTTNGTVASWEPIPVEVKAWVNFDGTGTVAIRASYNVSSITDNGVGNYTVNFTTAMVDANYSALSTTEADPTGDRRLIAPLKLNARTTSSVGVWGSASGSNVPLDTAYIAVAIFR